MTEHSKLPPSSAARRVACPGSRALEERYPEDNESPHAREGEAAHWVASLMLQKLWDNIYRTAPNGELITEEMIEGAILYVTHINDTLSKLNSIHPLITFRNLHIEERVDISRIHPECWGTPDCWLHVDNELHLWDYKFGHGYVEVFENWQLIEYAAGILDRIGINGVDDRSLNVTFHIVQPRCYHRSGDTRSWRVKASELRPYFNILEQAEYEAYQPIAKCNPSPECTYCTGRHACEALQRTALSVTDVTLLNTPWELKPSSLGNELRYLKRASELLDARITGLEEQASTYLRKGERVPFHRLEQTSGKEVWKVNPKEIMALGELLGFELKKPDAVITPKQAMKLGLTEAIIKPYSEQIPGAMKLILVEEDSPRKIFGGNTI